MSAQPEAITTQPGFKTSDVNDVLLNPELTEQRAETLEPSTEEVSSEEKIKKKRQDGDCCACCNTYDADNDVDIFCLTWFCHFFTDCIRCTSVGCYECMNECCTGCGDCDCGDCDCGDCDCGDCDCGDCDCSGCDCDCSN